MKIFLKILAIFLLVAAVELLLITILYREKPVEIQNMADVNVSVMEQYSTVYIDELYILDRYAFETIHEYRKDYETGYSSDPVYFAYEGSQPMDKNELFVEYFVVKFTDQSGKEYVASMSVLAGKRYSPSLKELPLKISAVAGAGIPSDGDIYFDFDDSNDAKLFRWKTAALDKYAESLQIPQAGITLGYQAENIQHLQALQQREDRSFRISGVVGGVALLAAGVFLLTKTSKKSQSAKEV